MTSYRAFGTPIQKGQALASLPDLGGRVALVTGGTAGVGRALVDHLAAAGAVTCLTARDPGKGERVRDEVRARSGNDDVHVVALDLSSLASVRTGAAAFLQGWDRLDLLLLNAGHMAKGARTVTSDGFETTIGVNHLGHALLVELLEARLRASAPNRVVVVASEAHRRARGGLALSDLMMTQGRFRPQLAYSRSKLANVLFARELARRLHGSGVDVRSAHPGGVDTGMLRQHFRGPVLGRLYGVLAPRLFISPQDAAAGLLRVALDPDLDGASGDYYELGLRKSTSDAGADLDAAARLWATTSDLLHSSRAETGTSTP